MITVAPVTLELRGVRLEPMTPAHADALVAAASDGKLWELWYTAIPEPDKAAKYVEDALEGQRAGAEPGRLERLAHLRGQLHQQIFRVGDVNVQHIAAWCGPAVTPRMKSANGFQRQCHGSTGRGSLARTRKSRSDALTGDSPSRSAVAR